MVRCPRDFRAICTAVAPDAVGTLRIYNPTPPVYDGHLVPCSSDHNRAIMPNCELQPRELLKNVPTRVMSRSQRPQILGDGALFFDRHEAFIDEFVHPDRPEFTPVAGAFYATESYLGRFFGRGICPNHAGLELLCEFLGALLVSGKDRRTQTVLGVVG